MEKIEKILRKWTKRKVTEQNEQLEQNRQNWTKSDKKELIRKMDKKNISDEKGKKDRLDKIAKKKDKSDIKDRFGMMGKKKWTIRINLDIIGQIENLDRFGQIAKTTYAKL